MDCNVIFTPQKVVFQDRTSGKKIGEGNLIDGLYVIKPEQLALTAATSSSSLLWHERLVHPSTRVLQHLNLPLIHDFNDCEPCQFAKLHKLPFSEHLNKYAKLFDLIHSDLWGHILVDSK
jgi:GAG-pre-integrase domain